MNRIRTVCYTIMKEIDPEIVLDLLQTRQSDRGYTEKKVEQEKLERILEAGRISPSACNSQPWKFIVVDDPTLKNSLADATSSRLLGMNHFTKQAPVHIVIVREKGNFTSTIGSKIKKKDFSLMDIGIAAIQMCIQARAEGLGSCMLGWFDEGKVKKLLHVPASKRVELIITLGYADNPVIRDKKRKSPGDIISYNRY